MSATHQASCLWSRMDFLKAHSACTGVRALCPKANAQDRKLRTWGLTYYLPLMALRGSQERGAR